MKVDGERVHAHDFVWKCADEVGKGRAKLFVVGQPRVAGVKMAFDA